MYFVQQFLGALLFAMHLRPLPQSQKSKLEKALNKMTRAFLCSDGYIKQQNEDGTQRKARSNDQVLAMVGVARVAIELRVRRLVFLRSLVLRRDSFVQVWAALLGTRVLHAGHTFLPDGTLAPTANAYIKMFMEDIEHLSAHDDLAWLPEVVRGRPLVLFAEEVVQRIEILDFSVLRKAALKAAIPPPGAVARPLPSQAGAEVLAQGGVFSCGLRCAD